MDCPTNPEQIFDSWGDRLWTKLQGRRYPLAGMFELTERCNLDCVHCYINKGAGCQTVREKELSTSEAKKVLDKIADAGCLFLVLTGGEPLLRPDFPEIYIHAIQRGIMVTLFTNGTMITPDIADLLAEWRPNLVDITIYGATQKTYEAVTRVPGSYQKAYRGIELLLERDIRLFIKTMVMTINQHELQATKAFAEERNLKFRYDGMLWPRLDGDRGPLKYQISIEDMIALDQSAADREAEWVRQAETFAGQKLRSEFLYTCGAGVHNFHVDSSGKLSICGMARQTSYDIVNSSFDEAWQKLGKLRNKKRGKDTPCRDCTIGAMCTLCPGLSYAMHGDEESPVEFACVLAHKRAEVLQFNYGKINEEIDIYE